MISDSTSNRYFLKQLLLPTLSFVLAAIAQIMLSRSRNGNGSTFYGWILYAIAGVLFIVAFRGVTVARFAMDPLRGTPETAPPPHLSRRQWGLLILAVIAMLSSIALFGSPASVPYAWNLHIVSVLLFLAVFIPFNSLRRPTPSQPAQIVTGILRALPIVVVLALATFARLWQLGEFPFGTWNDEAVNGLAAKQILKDASYRPLFVDTLPSHFIYLMTFSFSLLGINTIAIRLVTTAFGILAVLFAYLLFRRWFGARLGVVAACVLAVMRYHLTFSRFGVNAIATPAFELAALYFLDRALAEKKVSDFAWLGLTLGFGLAFYAAFRLFPIVLALFLGGLLISVIVKYGTRAAIGSYVKGLFQHWLIAALALVIAITPVAQFAVRDPNEFFARTNTVSIFEKRDEPNMVKALSNNMTKHLQMLNVQGDRNGRHNLPDAPMLDPVMGVLFILGVAYALWRWRDPPNVLMLLVFILMLQSGVLSLDFEAPQSLRTIGIIPALVYFITLPLAAVGHAINNIFQQRSEMSTARVAPGSGGPLSFYGDILWNVSLVALLALVTYLNFDTFFDKQKNDPSAWASYSAGETIVANEMNRLAASSDFVLSAAYDKYPTVRFLAGDVTNYQRWTVTDRLPLVRDDTGRGVVMLFDEKLLSTYNEAKRIYPGAKFIEHHAPAGGGTVLYEAILAPDDLRAVSGVVARYFKGDTVAGQPVKEEALPRVVLDWTKAQPLSEPFVAELRSTLYASEYGSYRFSVHGAPSSALWIDENPVSDAPLTLARGNHALRLQLPGNTDKVELWWEPPKASQAQIVPAANLFRPPVMNSGLLGAYYPSPDWSGDPAFTQIDPEIAFYFHIIPLPRPYSVEWKGKLFAPTAGAYRFALNSVDGSQLTLDQHVVADNPDGRTTIEGVTDLAQGWHDIDIHFFDKTSGTQIYLYWTPPGTTERELVPSRYLSPPMGQYPTDPESQP